MLLKDHLVLCLLLEDVKHPTMFYSFLLLAFKAWVTKTHRFLSSDFQNFNFLELKNLKVHFKKSHE